MIIQYLFNFLLLPDPCFQPVGITNGLVFDVVDLDISRLSGNCNRISFVFGEFHTSMTIKGIALRSTDTSPVKIPLDFAYIDANPSMRLSKSSRNNARDITVLLSFYIL